MAPTRTQNQNSSGVGVEIKSPSHSGQSEIPITSLTKIVLRCIALMGNGTIRHVVPQYLLFVKKTYNVIEDIEY